MYLSEEQKKLLMNGVARKNCMLTVPSSLIRLCFLYYGDSLIFNWNINISELQKLIENPSEKIHSNLFGDDNILFQCIVFSESCNKIDGFVLKLQSMPQNLKYIDIYYELSCKQNKKNICKDSLRLTENSNTISYYANIYEISSFQQFESLDLEFYIDILNNIKLSSPSTKVSVTVNEHLLSFAAEQFIKEYKLETKIYEIMTDSHKYFKYPVSMNEFQFHSQYGVCGGYLPLNTKLNLMEYLYQSPITQKKDVPVKLFNFAFSIKNQIRCPICNEINVLGYSRSNQHDDIAVFCIGDEWKCGNCWKHDPHLIQKLNQCHK